MKIWILKGNHIYARVEKSLKTWLVGYFTSFKRMEDKKTELETSVIRAEENPDFFPKGEYPELRVGEKSKQIRAELKRIDPNSYYTGYGVSTIWYDYEEVETLD